MDNTDYLSQEVHLFDLVAKPYVSYKQPDQQEFDDCIYGQEYCKSWFETLILSAQDYFQIDICISNERPGDYIILPNEISGLYGSKYFCINTGFTLNNMSTNYSFKHLYTVAYRLKSFTIFYVEEYIHDYYTVEMSVCWEYIKHYLSLGWKDVDPYIRIANRSFAIISYKTKLSTDPVYLWFPFQTMNQALADVKPVQRMDNVPARVRAIQSTFIMKNAFNHDLDSFTFVLSMVLMERWGDSLPLIMKRQTPNFQGQPVKCIFGKCQGYPLFNSLKPSAILDDPKLGCQRCVEDQPKLYQYFNCKSDKVFAPMDCEHNAFQALVGRQLDDCIEPEIDSVRSLMQFYNKVKSWLLPIKRVRLCEPSVWISHLRNQQKSQFSEGKYEEYQQIHRLSHATDRSSCFIKMEPHFKPDFVPRFITGRQSCQNALFGRYIYSVSKALSGLWKHKQNNDWADFDIDSDPARMCANLIYAGGCNRDDLGHIVATAVNDFTQLICLSTDYKRFDSHIHGSLHAVEYQVIKDLINVPNVNKILESQFQTRGAIRSHRSGYNIKYSVKGTRGSGDQNTSIGNSIINLLMQLYCLSKQFDLESKLKTGDVRILFMGDDTLVLMNNFHPDLAKYESDMRSLGMEVKSELTDINNARFLSGRFVPCRRVHDQVDTWLHIPLIGKAIQKCGLSLKKYDSDDTIKAWITQNALAYRRMFRCVTPLFNYFNTVLDKFYTKKRIVVDRVYLNTEYDYAATTQTITHLQDLYHITPIEWSRICTDAEEYYGCFQSSTWDHFIAKDFEDPCVMKFDIDMKDVCDNKGVIDDEKYKFSRFYKILYDQDTLSNNSNLDNGPALTLQRLARPITDFKQDCEVDASDQGTMDLDSVSDDSDDDDYDDDVGQLRPTKPPIVSRIQPICQSPSPVNQTPLDFKQSCDDVTPPPQNPLSPPFSPVPPPVFEQQLNLSDGGNGYDVIPQNIPPVDLSSKLSAINLDAQDKVYSDDAADRIERLDHTTLNWIRNFYLRNLQYIDHDLGRLYTKYIMDDKEMAVHRLTGVSLYTSMRATARKLFSLKHTNHEILMLREWAAKVLVAYAGDKVDS